LVNIIKNKGKYSGILVSSESEKP